MKKKYFWLVLFPAFLVLSGVAKASALESKTVSREIAYDQKFDTDGEPLVEVEPSFIIISDVSEGRNLIAYKLRREKWGHNVIVGYSLYKPVYHEPEFLTTDFDTLYGTSGALEVQYNYKRNLSIGSIGLEIMVGSFSTTSGGDDPGHSLSLMPVRMGFKYTMDTLSYEPYVAPYVSGGAYTVIYKEEFSSTTFNGNTQVAPYGTFGVLIQLDWMDRIGALESFVESGIQNSFLYIEGAKYMSSTAAKDPDFETDIILASGFNIEF